MIAQAREGPMNAAGSIFTQRSDRARSPLTTRPPYVKWTTGPGNERFRFPSWRLSA
jgi:hypothetical protein